ncbi:MAG TPA: hypothetical protein VMT17_18485 [Anaeromyxobacteraceae bacterium]|nr:hypothetical protein [Anaeromyxobacteraceae bacterium]
MHRAGHAALQVLLLAVPAVGLADGEPAPGAGEALPAALTAHPHEQQLTDLTPLNFFTEGWADPWAHRHRYTPDMALLRVTTNFLERELRFDYVYTNVAENKTLDNTQNASALLAYGLDRRLMVEVITNYQWNVNQNGSTTNGAGGGFLARLQLVDTPGQSYSFQLKVAPPNKGIGQTTTVLGYYLAGWQDMHELLPFLGRMGLYFSLDYDNSQGPAKAGATRNVLNYDVSLAETWTPSDMLVVGNLTTFLEFYASTPLDGTANGKTSFWITPGIRFWFLPKNSFTFGVDFEVSNYPTAPEIYRVNYILNF